MSDAVEGRDFERLLERHWGIVRKVAGVYAPDGDDRDDLAQEICLQLWRSFGRYDASRPFATWMYRVALNTSISHARRRRVTTEDLGRREIVGPEPEAATDRAEALYRLVRQQDELTRALVLLHLEDHSNREIAQLLGISESNVSTKLSRFRDRARRALAVTRAQSEG